MIEKGEDSLVLGVKAVEESCGRVRVDGALSQGEELSQFVDADGRIAMGKLGGDDLEVGGGAGNAGGGKRAECGHESVGGDDLMGVRCSVIVDKVEEVVVEGPLFLDLLGVSVAGFAPVVGILIEDGVAGGGEREREWVEVWGG